MGVPGLAGWLIRRYPFILREITEPAGSDEEDDSPSSASYRCDELYIDFNQIIHGCTHPSWRVRPLESEEQAFLEMTAVLARLVDLTRPTTLVFVAVDGVAPAAKIAQQRQRRYTSALREKIANRAELEGRQALEMEFGVVVPSLPKFDGNVITPGTPFMQRMEAFVRSSLRARLSSDPAWSSLQVVFSGAATPGEGEHKILAALRRRRLIPGYDPNARRAIVGQDADLILLSLATHEPRMHIVREQWGADKLVVDGVGGCDQSNDSAIDEDWTPATTLRLEVLSVAALRDGLRYDFEDLLTGASDGGAGPTSLPFDFEHLVDDFVALTCLCGNDFVPHIPCLAMHDHPCALETVLQSYRDAALAGELRSPIHERGAILHPERFAAVIRRLASGEKERHETRRQAFQRRMRRERRERFAKMRGLNSSASGRDRQETHVHVYDTEEVRIGHGITSRGSRREGPGVGAVNADTELPAGWRSAPALAEIRTKLKERVSERVEMSFSPTIARHNLGMPGDRNRYYNAEFRGEGFDSVDAAASAVAREFMRGVAWVLAYYYRGLGGDTGASWRWSYPYHAPPLIRDLASATPFKFAQKATPKSARALAMDGLSRRRVAKGAKERRAKRRRRKEAAAYGNQHQDRLEGDGGDKNDEKEEEDSGPVPTEVQLLSVIPPESASECLPSHCRAVMETARIAANLTAELSKARRLSAASLATKTLQAKLAAVEMSSPVASGPTLRCAFPDTSLTAAMLDRGGHRHSWMSSVRLPPVPMKELQRALQEVSSLSSNLHNQSLVDTSSCGSKTYFLEYLSLSFEASAPRESGEDSAGYDNGERTVGSLDDGASNAFVAAVRAHHLVSDAILAAMRKIFDGRISPVEGHFIPQPSSTPSDSLRVPDSTVLMVGPGLNLYEALKALKQGVEMIPQPNVIELTSTETETTCADEARCSANISNYDVNNDDDDCDFRRAGTEDFSPGFVACCEVLAKRDAILVMEKARKSATKGPSRIDCVCIDLWGEPSSQLGYALLPGVVLPPPAVTKAQYIRARSMGRSWPSRARSGAHGRVGKFRAEGLHSNTQGHEGGNPRLDSQPRVLALANKSEYNLLRESGKSNERQVQRRPKYGVGKGIYSNHRRDGMNRMPRRGPRRKHRRPFVPPTPSPNAHLLPSRSWWPRHEFCGASCQSLQNSPRSGPPYARQRSWQQNELSSFDSPPPAYESLPREEQHFCTRQQDQCATQSTVDGSAAMALIEMGFTNKQAVNALCASSNDLERAIEFLFNDRSQPSQPQPPVPQQYCTATMLPRAPTPTRCSPNDSVSVLKEMGFTTAQAMAALNSSGGSLSDAIDCLVGNASVEHALASMPPRGNAVPNTANHVPSKTQGKDDGFKYAAPACTSMPALLKSERVGHEEQDCLRRLSMEDLFMRDDITDEELQLLLDGRRPPRFT